MTTSQTFAIIIPSILVILLVLAASSFRLVQQYQRGIVLRFGRLLPEVREPGLRFIVPFVDRMTRVSHADRRHGHPRPGRHHQ